MFCTAFSIGGKISEIDDNALRRGLRRSPEVDKVLEGMNDALASLYLPSQSSGLLPNIVVCGLPRSGTTLAYQLLVHGLEVGYVNNVAARFWTNPALGLLISREAGIASHMLQFESHYGKSFGPAGPHEFPKFWRHWQGIESAEDFLDFDSAGGKGDWNGLTVEIARMQHIAKNPMVFKNMFVFNHLQEFLDEIPRTFIIYVERNSLDTAVSLLRAREAYYHDRDMWWSMRPPEFPLLAKLPWAAQIAGQVHYLKRLHHRLFRSVARDRVLQVRYEDLVTSPAFFVEAVSAAVESAFGLPLPVSEAVNSYRAFPRRSPEGGPDRAALKLELEALSEGT